MTTATLVQSGTTAPEHDHTPDYVSDQALMEQIRSGNEHALELLYDRYSKVVYHLAQRMLQNSTMAEDIVQETFWRVWRSSATYQSRQGRVLSWVYGIAHNLCIDELRRQRVRVTTVYSSNGDSVLPSIEDERVDVVGAAIHTENQRILNAAIRHLPEERREVLVLAYFSGLSQREIAERLQHPLGTIKTRTRLALKGLREILQRQGFSREEFA